MKKKIKDFFVFIGIVFMFGGFFICTWEAQNVNDQLTIMLYGFVLIVLGFALYLLNGGGKNVDG